MLNQGEDHSGQSRRPKPGIGLRGGSGVEVLSWRRGWLAILLLGALVSACARQNDPERYREAADRYYDQREFEKAKIEYGNLLRLQPTNAHAVARVGKILMAEGQVKDAAPLIAWSRERFPDDMELRDHLTQILALSLRSGTNRLWLRAEVEDLLRRDPAYEQAVLLLPTLEETATGLEALSVRLEGMRIAAGNKAVFHLAQADVLTRLGKTNLVGAELKAAETLEPQNPKVHAALAAYLFSAGRTAEGEAALSHAAQLSAPNSPIRENLARWFLQSGRLEEAGRAFEEITQKAPERTGAWLGLAEVALAQGKADDGEKWVMRALQQAPKDPGAVGLLAQVRLAAGKPGEAIEILGKLVELQPRSTAVQYQLAKAHLANGDSLRAITALERCLQLDPGAIQPILLLAQLNLSRGEAERSVASLRMLLQARPGHEAASLSLIRSERATGRSAEALRLAKETRQRFPSNAAFALEEGYLLRQQRQNTEARVAFESASHMTTNAVEAVEALVSMDVEARDFAAARRRLDAELARNPQHPVLWLLLSETERVQGDLGQANQFLRKTLDFDPDNLTAYFALARNAIAANRQKEAVAELEEVLKRDPKDLRALLMLGTLHSELGDLPRARQAYQQALAVRGDQPVMLNNLAYLMALQLGELEEGRSLALRAREADPKNPAIADTLGWIEYQRGEYGEALRLINEAAARLPGDPEVQYHLGMAHYMMGHDGPALIALRQAVAGSREYVGRSRASDSLAFLEGGADQSDSGDIAALEARRRQDPTDLLALLRLGGAYERAGDADKAAEAYEAALQLNPKAVATLTRMARFYAKPGRNPSKALELARTARGLVPSDPEVAAILGRLALAAGDAPWAYLLLKEGALQLSDRPEVALDLAWAAFSQGELPDVERSLTMVTKASRDSAFAKEAREFADLLRIATTASGAAQAPSFVAEVLKREPDHGPALFAQGTLEEAAGQSASARTAYERLLERYPAFHPGSRRLAILLAEHVGEDSRARDLGLRIREKYPRDEELAAAVGKAASRIGDYLLAEQLLAPTVRARPRDAAAHYHLGVAYQGLRRSGEARLMLEKAMSLQEKAPFLEDARSRLETLKRGG